MSTVLAELPHELSEDSPLAWQFQLSSNVPDTSLALYDKRLLRAAHATGFGGVIIRSYFGEQTSYGTRSTTINETYPGGTAAGSAEMSATVAETENVTLLSDEQQLAPSCQWPIAFLQLNRNELALRTATHIQDGMPQSKAWAYELNRSLHRGFNKVAWEKLKTDLSWRSEGEPFVSGLLTGFMVTNSIVGNYPDLVAMYGFAHFMRIITDIARNKKATGQSCLGWRRWSICPWIAQPDRWAAGVGMLSLQRLVRTTG